MKHVEFYRNEKDNSILAVVGVQAKQEVVAAKEKHVPAVRKEGGRLLVEVGSVTHPMEEKHYIEWIALVSDKSVDIRYLNPGEAPKAEFEGNSGVVYAYCNLHGLWKVAF